MQLRNRFWVLLVVIVLLGAVPRVAISGNSLPYIDDPDEPSLYLMAQQWRGLFQFDSAGYHNGYPPIFPALNLVVQLVMERFGDPSTGDVIGVLRLISVVFNLATGVFVALIARRLADDFAGLLAAAFWMFSPALILQAPVALANPLAVLMATIALWLAVVAATDRDRRVWAVWSVCAGLVGVFVKYPIAPVLATGGLVILWVLFRENRRRGIQYSLFSALLVVISVVLLYLNNGIKYSSGFVSKEGRTTGLDNLVQSNYLIDNLQSAISPLTPLAPLFFAIIVGLGFVVLLRRRKEMWPVIGGLLIVGVLFIVQPWAVTSFSVVKETNRLKDVLPATSAAIVLLSVALAQILTVLPDRQAIGRGVTVAALGLLVFVPQVNATIDIVREYTPPDTRVALRAWAETTLEPDWVLVTYDNAKVFNNYWSGLPGSKWFDWHRVDDITSMDFDEWRERFPYAVLTEQDLEFLLAMPGGEEHLNNLLLLREFDSPPDHRGPTMSVFRSWRMMNETNVSFGDRIRFVGYDRTRHDAEGNTVLDLQFYWQADQAPTADYSLFVHLAPADDRASVVQWDGPPAGATRPTYTWTEPTETLVGPLISLEIPADLPAGEYRILAGLYDYATGQRLSVSINDGDDSGLSVLEDNSLVLGTVVIE